MRTKLRWIGMSLCLAVVMLTLFGVALAQEENTFDHFVYLPLVMKPLPPTDLALAQTSAPNPYVAGKSITYTLTLTNAGPTVLSEVMLTTLLPQAVLTPVYTTTIGTYRPVSGTWLSLTLGAGDAISLQISGTVSETFTGTLTSTAVVTPVGAREEDATDNAAIDVNPVPLLNPGFEGGYWHKTFEGEDVNKPVPESWVAWWETGQSPIGQSLAVPEIVRVIDDSNPHYLDPVLRIHSGKQAFMLSRWGAYRAGLYQRVEGLPPGATVAFSAYAHAWACQEDPPPALSCGDAFSFRSRVGVDPTGMDARNLDDIIWDDIIWDDVIWSEDHWIYDAFETVGPVTATVGSEGAVTVYIESYGKWPYKHNDAYWDDTLLIIRP